jgi:hypothetical protein
MATRNQALTGGVERETGLAGHGVTLSLPRSDEIASLHATRWTFARKGSSRRQGPHHDAQNVRITIFPRWLLKGINFAGYRIVGGKVWSHRSDGGSVRVGAPASEGKAAQTRYQGEEMPPHYGTMTINLYWVHVPL